MLHVALFIYLDSSFTSHCVFLVSYYTSVIKLNSLNLLQKIRKLIKIDILPSDTIYTSMPYKFIDKN